jgi:hypothetical protein
MERSERQWTAGTPVHAKYISVSVLSLQKYIAALHPRETDGY